MKKNIELYRRTVYKNIKNIEKILIDLKIEDEIPIIIYDKFLNQSVEQVIEKWETGRKYCRTEFIQKAFEKEYLKELTELSLFVDSAVNILDDLLDEDIDKNNKTLMMVEVTRVFSLLNFSCPSKKIQIILGEYFNKLITLALSENLYQNKILKDNNFKNIIDNSANLLLYRGMDIDFFSEIALINFKNKNIIEDIKYLARIFRAINIFKKDIKDIKHDRKNNINTVTLTILNKKINFSDYSVKLVEDLISRIDLRYENIDRKYYFIFNNFKRMIEKEKKEIIKIL